jgi:hypothetical protein
MPVKKKPSPQSVADNSVNNMHKHRTQEPCEQFTVIPPSNKLLVCCRTGRLKPTDTKPINELWPRARLPKPRLDRVKSQCNKITGMMKLKLLL